MKINAVKFTAEDGWEDLILHGFMREAFRM